jgi:hypothetical protein
MKLFQRIIVVGTLCATGAFANFLTNGSLEDTGSTFTTGGDGGDNLSVGSTAIPGWTVNTAALAWISNTNTFGLSTPFGSFFLDLTGYHDSSPYGGIQQSVALAAGNYTLTFDLGTDQSIPVGIGPVSVLASAGNQSNVVETFTPSGSGNQWGMQTLNFNVASPGAVMISLVGNSTAGGSYLGLDNVDLEVATIVPEPGMALPILIGAGLFGLVRRKRAVR